MSPDYFVTHVPGYFGSRTFGSRLATRGSPLAITD
jgi:hypothetical protein